MFVRFVSPGAVLVGGAVVTEPLNFCFDLYFKYDKIGRIEIKNNKLVKNEAYTDQLILRPYARVKEAFTMVQLLQERVMCKERWDTKQLNHIGLTEYN